VPATPPAVDAGAVRERLDHARVAMLWRLSRGDGRSAARGSALAVMDRNATSAVYEQARTGERAGMESTTEIVGYRRVTSARPCGACLALSSQRRATDQGLDVHDRCSCSAEPIVRAVREQVFRPDGAARVAAMSDEELAATFRGTGGAEKAALVRSRGVEALVAYANGQLVEAPLATIT
jgi:hypothetical protein